MREPSVRMNSAGRPLSAPVVVRAPQLTHEDETVVAEDEAAPFVEAGESPAAESSKRLPSTSDGMLTSAREALSNLEDLKKWVYDDSTKSAGPSRVSAATKQRGVRKTLLKIAHTCHSLRELEKHCEASKAEEAEMSKELKLKEESRYDTLNALNETAGELEKAVNDLKTLRERYDILEREKILKEKKLEQIEERSKQNLEALDKLEKAHERTEKEKKTISDKYNKLLETERKLRLPDLRHALATSLAKIAKYEKSIEQSQKIIAQVTADNLVFLTKFKDAEEKYKLSEMKREELQTMVDDQKGPWFDKIRSDIQKQVESDWQRIHKLENDLTAAQITSKKQLDDLQEKASLLESENGGLRDQVASMEERIKKFERKDRQREDQDIKAAADFESLNQLLKDTMAENKVLRETISDERHSIADLTLESQDQKNAMELLEGSLRDNQKIVNQLRVELQREKWSLETQKRINRELMSRKEEIEWKLMELSVASQGEMAAAPAPSEGPSEAARPSEAAVRPPVAMAAQPRAGSLEKVETSASVRPQASAPVKDEANESDGFSFEVVDTEDNQGQERTLDDLLEEPGAATTAGGPEKSESGVEMSQDASQGDTQTKAPLLTESNLQKHRKGKKLQNPEKSSGGEEKSSDEKRKKLTIKELEDTIVTSKDKHQQFLDSIYSDGRDPSAPIENPLDVHKRLVTTILDGETIQSMPVSIPRVDPNEPSSAEATIASMIQDTITEHSSIGELETSIAIAKQEYDRMMSNFSSIVEGLKDEKGPVGPGFAAMPVLPESIQRLAEEQFSDHYWHTHEGSKSETKEVIAASEIKVSEWLDSKIDDEWRKQFMPLVEDAEDPEDPEGNEGQ